MFEEEQLLQHKDTLEKYNMHLYGYVLIVAMICLLLLLTLFMGVYS